VSLRISRLRLLHKNFTYLDQYIFGNVKTIFVVDIGKNGERNLYGTANQEFEEISFRRTEGDRITQEEAKGKIFRGIYIGGGKEVYEEKGKGFWGLNN
jgi:hypothetical protein